MSDFTINIAGFRRLNFNHGFFAEERTITVLRDITLPLENFTGTLLLGTAAQRAELILPANAGQPQQLTIHSVRSDSFIDVMANNAAEPAVLSGPITGTGFIRANASGGSTKHLRLDYSYDQIIPLNITTPGANNFLAIEKRGPGAVTLAGNQVRNRRTTVSEGVLRVDGTASVHADGFAQLSGAHVAAGAGFGGRGTWNLPLTLNDGARMDLVDGAVGTFTLGYVPLIAGDLEWSMEMDPDQSASDRIHITAAVPMELPTGAHIIVRPHSHGGTQIEPQQEFAILTANGGIDHFEAVHWSLDLSRTPWHGGEVYRRGNSIYIGNLSTSEHGLKFSEPAEGLQVSENPAAPASGYHIMLRSQPTANVTVHIQPAAGLVVTPNTVVFTPANWQIPQLVTVDAINNDTLDAGSDGWYERILTHLVSSADTNYNSIAARPVTVRIFDTEVNLPPVLSRVFPQRPYLYVDSDHTNALVFEVDALDELVLNPPHLIYTWEIVSAPDGATAQLNDTGRSTRLSTDAVGTYVVRVTVLDDGSPQLSDSMEWTVQRGALPLAGPTDEALRVWLKMDSEPNPQVTDSSGFDNHATRTNGSIDLNGGRTGEPGDGAFVGATNAYLTIPYNTTLDPGTGFTHSLWFNAQSRSANNGMVHFGRNQSALFTLYWDGQGRLNSRVVANNEDLHTFRHAFEDHQWYHVTVVYDPSLPAERRVALYVNGELDSYSLETSTTWSMETNWSLTVGRTYDTATSSFNGRIDDYRYYVRPLSAEAVRQVSLGLNRAPSLSGATALSAVAGEPLAIAVSVTDPDSSPSVRWRRISGPGLTLFANASSAETSVTFSSPGEYWIEALAIDGADSVATLPVQVTVTGAVNPILLLSAENGTILSNPNQSVFTNLTTVVTLEAQPLPGFRFTGWQGDLPQGAALDNPLQVLMDRDRNLTALFEPVRYTLQVVAEHGGVIRDPFAVDYSIGAVVTVQAFAMEGYFFNRWIGDVDPASAENNPLQVVMDRNRLLEAEFLPVVVEEPDPLDAFTAWLDHFFPDVSDPAIIAFDADPDNDGMCNLLEYAFGLDPSVPDSGYPALRMFHSPDGRHGIEFRADEIPANIVITLLVFDRISNEWLAIPYVSHGIPLDQSILHRLQVTNPLADDTVLLRLRVELAP